MPTFEAPSPSIERTRNRAWADTAHQGMKDADYLWGEYWERFNTMQIPIFDKEEYFNTAIAIAKTSKDQQDFERIFEKINKERREMLEILIGRVANRTIYHCKEFQCQAALHATERVCQTGCLQHFLQILKGTAFGWEADIAEEDSENEVPSGGNTDDNIGEDAQDSAEDETKDPWDDYDYSCRNIPPEWETQIFDEYDWNYETPNERKARKENWGDDVVFHGIYTQYMAPTPDGTAHGALGSSNEIPSTQQPLPLISSDESISEKEAEENGAQDVPEKHSGGTSDDGSSTLTKKRVRFDDDDDDIINHEPKRQKLEDSTAPTPTYQAPPAIQEAAGGSVTRKRSRPDDDDDADNGYKRQKIESLPSPPTSHTSSSIESIDSAEDTSTNNPPTESPNRSVETPDTDIINGERKRRKRSSTRRTPRASPPRSALNSRSSRRSNSSTLWELDSSGKPHSVS